MGKVILFVSSTDCLRHEKGVTPGRVMIMVDNLKPDVSLSLVERKVSLSNWIAVPRMPGIRAVPQIADQIDRSDRRTANIKFSAFLVDLENLRPH